MAHLGYKTTLDVELLISNKFLAAKLNKRHNELSEEVIELFLNKYIAIQGTIHG